ncbi:hypothetical protein EBR57_10530 [bacterium]|nr:hypothetical protein [bacterium]
MENGPGIAPSGDWKRLLDRGYVPSFRDLPDQRYLKVYTDQVEDSTATILFRGSDTYNDRIRTLENNEYIDGERLNLSAGSGNSSVLIAGFTGSNTGGNSIFAWIGMENSKPKYQNLNGWIVSNNGSVWRVLNASSTQVAISAANSAYPWQATFTPTLTLTELPRTTVNAFRSIDAINKTATKGWVRVYAVDPTTGSESCVAILAPDETLPMYRRYAIPGFESEEGSTVTVLAKRKFIPIISDDDDLIISNLGALKMMLIAIEKEENNNLEEASAYEAKAVLLLQEELREVQGSALGRPQVQMEMFAMGEIPNMA